jgi:hypothetical protein
MTIKALYPTVRPTLNLDFAKTKALDPRVTFTRIMTGSSVATYVGADGLIKTAGNNVPRFDHNPATGESLGLLVEEARTNLISNSSATGSTNGVIGSGGALPTGWNLNRLQGGITVEVIGTGTEANGLAYIDLKFSGTTSDGNWTLLRLGNTFSVTNGTAYSSFIYAKTVAGTVPSILQFNFPGSSGNVELGAITTTFAKYSAILTSTATTTASPLLLIGFSSSGQVLNYTMRIGGIQLEAGSFPTSYIPTTSATVTRAADVASISGTNYASFINYNEGTWVSSVPRLNGTGGRIFDSRSSTLYASANTSGYQYSSGSSSTITATYPLRGAVVYNSTDVHGAANGTIQTSNTGGRASSHTYIDIGSANTAAAGVGFLNGPIARLAFYPVRLPDAQLQALTAT